jgi:hypothetical protein
MNTDEQRKRRGAMTHATRNSLDTLSLRQVSAMSLLDGLRLIWGDMSESRMDTISGWPLTGVTLWTLQATSSPTSPPTSDSMGSS